MKNYMASHAYLENLQNETKGNKHGNDKLYIKLPGATYV